MANPLTYTNTFADSNTGLGTKIQANFADITTLVNGNLNGDNIPSGAGLSVLSLAATTSIKTPVIQARSASNIIVDIASFAGSRLKVTNSDDTVLFEIDTNGEVVI
jgi:hypothetical protein